MDLDLHAIIKELGKRRPIFHSEADFQLSLFRLLCEKHYESPGINIILERTEGMKNQKISRDISIIKPKGIQTVIELKYVSTQVDFFKYRGEFYNLKEQEKGNIRHGFWEDVQKLENFEKKENNDNEVEGFLIFLTNNEIYWKEESNGGANQYQNYQTFEGRVIKDTELLIKSNDTPKQNVKLRNGPYGPLKWEDYSYVNNNYLFRFLLLQINAN